MIHSLRNVAAFAVAGASVAGALTGHGEHPVDPGYIGLALGALIGFIAWAAGKF